MDTQQEVKTLAYILYDSVISPESVGIRQPLNYLQNKVEIDTKENIEVINHNLRNLTRNQNTQCCQL